ncbi:MAG: GNAT family N-acetyltransferase [Balneolaceae bacterium]|nr:GNAT family N-acetyltransferase [Balneolaceae bacterium]
MNGEITIEQVDPGDGTLIRLIARWYLREWDAPVGKTVRRLSGQPDEDSLFHLVLRLDGEVVATGGLFNEVNIYNVHPRFRRYRPWVGLLYTREEFRGRGFGGMLLNEIEHRAQELGLSRLYLYTFTAESLYKRCGWTVMDRVPYKGHETAVMKKSI